MKTLVDLFRTSVAALRLLVVLTVVLGLGYPLLITAVGRVPGLQDRADGSLIKQDGKVIGSRLIGQDFTGRDGNPLPQYFQPRPSAAGDGYDPTATSASNLGPESIVDTLPDPADKTDAGKPSLLTQVCSRSLAVGRFDGVDGARPFCTPDGVGAVLAVFWSGPGYAGHIDRVVSVNQTGTPFISDYHGVAVEPAKFGVDYSAGQLVPIRGSAAARPAVPADAVTASGSGLDPDISPAYAAIQLARVAAARGVPVDQIRRLVSHYTSGRALGFLGDRVVNVVQLNQALDRTAPVRSGR